MSTRKREPQFGELDLLAPEGCVHDRPAYMGFDALKTSRMLDKAMSRVLDLHGSKAQRFMRPNRHENLEPGATLEPRKGKALTLADAPPCL